MTVTLGHALLGIFLSGLALCGIVLLAARSTRRLYPIRCVHCWMYNRKETVISLAEQPEQWGICPECVGLYWHFSEQETGHAAPPPAEGEVPAAAGEASLVH